MDMSECGSNVKIGKRSTEASRKKKYYEKVHNVWGGRGEGGRWKGNRFGLQSRKMILVSFMLYVLKD